MMKCNEDFWKNLSLFLPQNFHGSNLESLIFPKGKFYPSSLLHLQECLIDVSSGNLKTDRLLLYSQMVVFRTYSSRKNLSPLWNKNAFVSKAMRDFYFSFMREIRKFSKVTGAETAHASVYLWTCNCEHHIDRRDTSLWDIFLQ